MPSSLLLSLHPKATLLKKDRRIVGIEAHSKRLTFEDPSKGIQRVLKLLGAGPIREEILEETVIKTNGQQALAVYYYCIGKLESLGALCYTAANGSEHLMTFVPSSPNYRPDQSAVQQDQSYQLSRFAYLRSDGDQMILESPLSHSTAAIHSPHALLLLMRLTGPLTPEQLRKEFHRIRKQSIELLLNLLLRHQFLETAQEYNLIQWEFHDLIFHAASRQGRSFKPFGGTFRFQDKVEPLPAVKPQPSGEAFELWKPDLKMLEKEDRPFSVVLEERKSIRAFDEKNPITIQQLGEFLYRVARVKKMYPKNPAKGLLYEVTTRPYPGGGGCYELELYLIIQSCRGIPPGLYFYDPRHHRLHQISSPSPATDQLLQHAWRVNGEGIPQILICISARFARVFWKYQGMAYALILKDVGVLYQTMYLVATAMGLAPCALGAGDSDLFTQAAGIDYYTETSVGEFMLGSKKKSKTRK